MADWAGRQGGATGARFDPGDASHLRLTAGPGP